MRQNATFLLRPPATPREAHEADGTRPMRPVPVASGRSACHNLRQGSVQTERATLQKLRQAAPAGLRRSANFRKLTTQQAAHAVPPARLRWRQAAAPLLPLYVGCLHLRLHLRLWLYACCSALQRRTYSYRRPIGRYWAVALRASAKVPRGLRLCSCSCLCLCLI